MTTGQQVGQIAKTCNVCGVQFLPTANQIRKSESRCLPCRSVYEREYRQRRKAEGRPIRGGGNQTAEARRATVARYLQSEAGRLAARNNAKRSNMKPENQPKIAARRAVRSALAAGRMKREPCAQCGNNRTHGHHADYSKPLEVIWLCPQHHADIHRQARGED